MNVINKINFFCSFLALTFLFTVNSVFGQEVEKDSIYEKTNRRNEAMAKEAIRTGNIYLAIAYLEKNYTTDSSLQMVQKLAPLYVATHNYIKAEEFYKKITQSELVQKNPASIYYLAQAQKSNGKYLEAKENYLLYKKRAGEVEDEAINKLYKIELEGVEMALKKPKPNTNLQVKNLGDKVNQPHIEFNPIPFGANGLIFGSLDEKSERVYSLENTDSIPLPQRKLYVAQKKDGDWVKNSEFDGPFNSMDGEFGNGCFSIDSSQFYFTVCKRNPWGKNLCKIFMTEKKDSTWSTPVELDAAVNSDGFTTTHPTMGRDEKKKVNVLYFSSDRDGSKGGMDIWFSEFDAKKGAFKPARNAGSKINTVGDEMTPYYDLATKTLYFASNGHPSYGGLDIFKCTGELTKWTKSDNIGSDINSSSDDLDFAIQANGKRSFFVSNRPGGKSLYHATCCDDIYSVDDNKFIEIIANICVEINGTKTKANEKTVNLYMVNEEGKTLIRSITGIDSCLTYNLRPDLNYVVESKKEGYFDNEISIKTVGIKQNKLIEEKIVMTIRPKEAIVISDIKYDFDSPNLTPRSKSIIDTTLLVLFKKYPTLIFELSSHTDSKGGDEYNMRLSQKRAESVVNYLKSKGVPEIQMIAKGYGETKPIAPNDNPDGSDNPTGRDKNRRTEFKIIGELEEELIDLQEGER